MLPDAKERDGLVIIELSNLLEDPDKNRFALAKCLSNLDSRMLSPSVRKDLGLANDPPTAEDMSLHRLPTLFVPSPDSPPRWPCPNSEGYLAHAFYYGQLRDERRTPLYLLGCLIGKKDDSPNGVCFRTTEFPNGAVFVKGVWYRPRGPKSIGDWEPDDPGNMYRILGGLTIHDSDQREEEMLQLDLHPKYPSSISTKYLIVVRDCGGSWEPVREFSRGYPFYYLSEM